MTREDDLKELAINLQAAIAKARALNLPISAHILSMPLTEVSRTSQASVADEEKNAMAPPLARRFFAADMNGKRFANALIAAGDIRDLCGQPLEPADATTIRFD
jgi:hypothetical protein